MITGICNVHVCSFLPICDASAFLIQWACLCLFVHPVVASFMRKSVNVVVSKRLQRSQERNPGPYFPALDRNGNAPEQILLDAERVCRLCQSEVEWLVRSSLRSLRGWEAVFVDMSHPRVPQAVVMFPLLCARASPHPSTSANGTKSSRPRNRS